MVIFFLIFVSSVIALSVDWYIYRRIIKRHNFGKIWKIGYLVYAVLVDTMVVTSLIAYTFALDWQSTASMRAILWIIGLFFLNAVPKAVYALVSLLDYPRQKKLGRVSHLYGYTGTVFAFLCFLWIGYGLTWGRSVIRVETVELSFENLPPSFDGLGVVQFADTHLGNVVNSDRFLAKLRDTVNSLRPDIVVNAGDIVNVHERELDKKALETFGAIQARYGVFSVLGNHDLGIYVRDTTRTSPELIIRELTRKQQEMGWTVLRNRTVTVYNGRDSIYITGLDYPDELVYNSHSRLKHGADLSDAYEGVPADGFNLTISHAPQLWDEILRLGSGQLTVAGHVHSMQIKFSVGKWQWSPARLFYDRWSGLYEQDGRFLYINDGTGYVMFPMRIGTKPEVTLFILRSGRKMES